MDAKIYISFDGDKVGHLVGMASLRDDVPELSRISQAIEKGNELIKSWAITSGGQVISMGGDEARLWVYSDHLEDLENIREKYHNLVGATVSVGVGLKISEADKALLYAKLHGGDKIVFYTPEIEQEIEKVKDDHESEEDKIFKEYLDKAEHPLEQQFKQLHESSIQEKQQHEYEQQNSLEAQKVKASIVSILQELRNHAQDMESIKQQAPELYGAINKLIQGLISLGRTSISMKKAEGSLGLHQFHMNFPPGFILPPGPSMSGRLHGGRIKVESKDGRKKWISARAGLVMSPEGIPTSSRNPSGTHK